MDKNQYKTLLEEYNEYKRNAASIQHNQEQEIENLKIQNSSLQAELISSKKLIEELRVSDKSELLNSVNIEIEALKDQIQTYMDSEENLNKHIHYLKNQLAESNLELSKTKIFLEPMDKFESHFNRSLLEEDENFKNYPSEAKELISNLMNEIEQLKDEIKGISSRAIERLAEKENNYLDLRECYYLLQEKYEEILSTKKTENNEDSKDQEYNSFTESEGDDEATAIAEDYLNNLNMKTEQFRTEIQRHKSVCNSPEREKPEKLVKINDDSETKQQIIDDRRGSVYDKKLVRKITSHIVDESNQHDEVIQLVKEGKVSRKMVVDIIETIKNHLQEREEYIQELHKEKEEIALEATQLDELRVHELATIEKEKANLENEILGLKQELSYQESNNLERETQESHLAEELKEYEVKLRGLIEKSERAEQNHKVEIEKLNFKLHKALNESESYKNKYEKEKNQIGNMKIEYEVEKQKHIDEINNLKIKNSSIISEMKANHESLEKTLKSIVDQNEKFKSLNKQHKDEYRSLLENYKKLKEERDTEIAEIKAKYLKQLKSLENESIKVEKNDKHPKRVPSQNLENLLNRDSNNDINNIDKLQDEIKSNDKVILSLKQEIQKLQEEIQNNKKYYEKLIKEKSNDRRASTLGQTNPIFSHLNLTITKLNAENSYLQERFKSKISELEAVKKLTSSNEEFYKSSIAELERTLKRRTAECGNQIFELEETLIKKTKLIQKYKKLLGDQNIRESPLNTFGSEKENIKHKRNFLLDS